MKASHVSVEVLLMLTEAPSKLTGNERTTDE